MDLVVATLNKGRNVSQIEVRASVAGAPILSVRAALGPRAGMPEDQWVDPPRMPAPDNCVPLAVWPPQDEKASFMDPIEVRLTPEAAASSRRGDRSADGRRTMWMKMRDDVQVDASVLAAFADFVPSGIAAAFGPPGGGNSLDNTLRICRVVPTDWVLCDVRVSAATGGFGHGEVSMFAQDGTLLATGSQSVILRFLPALA